MSFADNPVWTGLADLSTYRQGLLTFKVEPGCLSFFWLKLSRLSSPFTGRVEITQHQRRMDIITSLQITPHWHCGKTCGKPRSLRSLGLRMMPTYYTSEREARAAVWTNTPGHEQHPPHGGLAAYIIWYMGTEIYVIFLRVFFSFFNIFKAFSLETHSCALIWSFTSFSSSLFNN